MKFNVMSRLKKEKTLVCSNKKERKLLITSVSWARSAMSNTYIHEPFQKTNYKIGEILLVALGLSFGVSENIGYVKIEKIDQNGNLYLKLVEKAPSLMEKVGRR